uniref:Uncharacterized protein n=1 Tax=Arundo donax TaxID=35708 RepID=A0A0A9BU93_ARUDO
MYRSTPALGCAVMGALLLLTVQVVCSVASGCYGCCWWTQDGPPSETKRAVAVTMSLVSWMLLVIAAGMFFYGAAWNAGGERRPAKVIGPTKRECYVMRVGVFVTASVLSLVVVVLAVASYVLLQVETATPPTGTEMELPGVAMGWPAYLGHPRTGGYDGDGGAGGAAGWQYQGKDAAATM